MFKFKDVVALVQIQNTILLCLKNKVEIQQLDLKSANCHAKSSCLFLCYT